jgi:ABC-type Zn uptake system ZnuABC Zn-binding protein ZnuA
VTGHAAFDYLARDLGLNIVATLREVPGETGSAAEMARLIDTVRATKPAAIFWEPPFGDKLAETIARETGTAVYPLNPFNTDAGLPLATTPEQKRRMYEDVMNQNLATLQRALGAAESPSVQ